MDLYRFIIPFYYRDMEIHILRYSTFRTFEDQVTALVNKFMIVHVDEGEKVNLEFIHKRESYIGCVTSGILLLI